MSEYKCIPLGNNVEEMFIGPFGSSLKNECFVDEEEAYCMVYEQKHAIQKTMEVETRYINEQKYNELKRFNIHGGDIIVSCRGTIGETFIVPDNAPLGIMHPSIMKIRLKEGVYDKYYFNLLLKSRLKKHKTEANGSGIKMAISATELGKELFPVPTMEKQLEIASIISRISSVIEKRIQELSALDDLIKARFVEMFGNLEDTVRLGGCCEVHARIGWQALTRDEHRQTGKYMLVTGTDFIDGRVNYDTCVYVEKERYEMDPHIILRENDVLITKDGSIGKVAVVHDLPKPATLNGGVFVVRPDERFNKEYISYVFRGPLFERFVELSKTGATIKHLNQKHLVEFSIPLPTNKEQEAFAVFSKQIDKSKFVKPKRAFY